MIAFQEIVPPEVLERPWRDEARRIERDLAAELLDPYLRRLASQEARAHRVLGTIAHEFLAREAHHQLGFSRLEDYARERLGLSAREIQTTARTSAALHTLRACAAAFARGAISWTQLRLIVPVAQPATEAAWLALAAGRTVRALEALINQARSAAGHAASSEIAASAGVPPASTTSSPASTSPPASPTIPSAFTTPPLPPGSSAAVAAALEEHADGERMDGEPTVRFHLRCPRWVAPLWREAIELARRVAGEPLPVWRAAEAIAAEGLAAPEASPRPVPPTSPLERAGGAAARESPPDPTETRAVFAARAGFERIDWSEIVEALPPDIERLEADLAAADAPALDHRMRAVVHTMRRTDWQLGRLLRLFFDCRLHELFGYESAARYARERLGLSTSKVRHLVALERRTWESPALMDAYRSGALSALQASILVPILTEQTDAAWVARARAVTLRRLADEVAWALDVRDAAPEWAPVPPPPLGAVLVAPGEAPMASPEAALAAHARQMRAPLDQELAAEVVFRGPGSVVAMVRTAIAAFHPSLTPAWTGLVRLLARATAEWEQLPRHRDPVFARDGWRCAVPACSARRNLHDHHVIFRSRGGDNARDNRITVCAWHHLRAIHGGSVRAWGRAPDAVHWELGLRPGTPPFLRFLGDCFEGDDERREATAA